MAATRLIALHINKGKTVAQCLADRTDYSENAAKTEDGKYISAYACDAKTCDEEFLLSKRQYEHITGRTQAHDVIAYQIRQSFKPGEITPEEANKVGYETAMRFTKGKHAFIVATHVDRAHIHNHIIFNSTTLDCARKFRDFRLSGLALARISDIVCLEHRLSVIIRKPYGERQKRTEYPEKKSQRDEICESIDAALARKPKDFRELIGILQEAGYEYKDGKQPALRGKGHARFARFRSLDKGYSVEELCEVIAGNAVHKSKFAEKTRTSARSAQVHQKAELSFLIDIRDKMQAGKGAGYARWAKVFNLKQMAKAMMFMEERGIKSYAELKFEEEYGDPWESSRQDFDFIQDSVVDVLSDMDFMSESAARNWCEKATESYQISIEDFAKRVKSYIDKKGNNHHVVFLVDEIGQYIGDDSKLMLNLQTVTEELGKECMGKAWVIVTSQQDIDSITKVKGNDFSKIQGRFDTRLSLSSANVDAVIKKRILDKTETAAQSLRLLYDQKATIIKNLIVFNDGVEKKLYANAEDFAEVYPFVPYQFNLLASVLTSIRTHGASGKHLSEGERSMLALFKESAMQLMDDEMGAIVPFYRFYDALENFLDHSHSSVIIRAYDNSYINPEKKEKDVFAINVLKTLFLIKYVLEIEANVDNIVSLMITSIDDDRISLKAQVEDALKVLMRQMLIQKNGSIYVFLTDEEQEINNEIEKENVEMPEVITKIAELIYEDIFSSKKYQYPSFGGRYAFSFNQTVDDRPYKANQNYDIGLRVLTPWYEGGTDDGTLRLLSGQGKEVLVVLPNDDAFLTEMRAYLKIERFLRKNTSVQLAKYETIKEAKRVEMRERNGNAKLLMRLPESSLRTKTAFKL